MFHKSTLADLIVLFVLAFFVSVKDYIGLLYQFTFSASKLWWWTCSCPPVLNHQPTEFNFLSHLIIFSVHTSRCIVRPSSARTQRRGEGSGSWLRMHRVASENCNSSIFIETHRRPAAGVMPTKMHPASRHPSPNWNISTLLKQTFALDKQNLRSARTSEYFRFPSIRPQQNFNRCLEMGNHSKVGTHQEFNPRTFLSSFYLDFLSKLFFIVISSVSRCKYYDWMLDI